MTTSPTVKVQGPVFPIAGILGLIFITLKLTGVIAWPWIWVLAPFWIPFLAMIVIIAALFVWVLFHLDDI